MKGHTEGCTNIFGQIDSLILHTAVLGLVMIAIYSKRHKLYIINKKIFFLVITIVCYILTCNSAPHLFPKKVSQQIIWQRFTPNTHPDKTLPFIQARDQNYVCVSSQSETLK